MVAEGIIALIWASAGVTYYAINGSLVDGMAGLSAAIAAEGQGGVVYEICTTLLGPVGGVLAMIGVIADALKAGDKIQLVGFGAYELKDVPAKTGINPATGGKVEIAACKKPQLKFGKSFKDGFNA